MREGQNPVHGWFLAFIVALALVAIAQLLYLATGSS